MTTLFWLEKYARDNMTFRPDRVPAFVPFRPTRGRPNTIQQPSSNTNQRTGLGMGTSQARDLRSRGFLP